MGPESLHVNKTRGNAHAAALWLTFSVATIYRSGSQRVVPRPSEPASPGNLRERHVLGSQPPDPRNLEFWG